MLAKKRKKETGQPPAEKSEGPGGHRSGVGASFHRHLGNSYLQKMAASGEAEETYEREANRVADAVLQGPAPHSEELHRKEAAATSLANPPSKLGLASGRSLPAPVRQDMEARFGRDFSHVRIHTDERAAASSKLFEAQAYTYGRHVAFAKDEYAPASARGRKLLAHELAHVVQQEKVLGKAYIQRQADPERSQTGVDSDEERADEVSRNVEDGYPTLEDLSYVRKRFKNGDMRAVSILLDEYDSVYKEVNNFVEELDGNIIAWKTTIRNVGSAFATAMDTHRAVCKEANAEAAQERAMFLAVISVASVGALSAASTTLQAAVDLSRAQEAVVNVSEDMLQTAVDKTSSLTKGGIQQSARGEAVGGNALVYQNELLNRLENAHLEAKQSLISIMENLTLQERLAKGPLRSREITTDLLEKQLEQLTASKEAVLPTIREIRSSRLFDPPNISKRHLPLLAKKIERAIWAKWLTENLRLFITERYVGAGSDVPKEKLGRYVYPLADAIIARLNTLEVYDANHANLGGKIKEPGFLSGGLLEEEQGEKLYEWSTQDNLVDQVIRLKF